MGAADEAIDRLYSWLNSTLGDVPIYPGDVRVLLDEYEALLSRLDGNVGAPPTDGEREALIDLVNDARLRPHTGRTLPEVVADVILAAGFHRQGPATDDERDALIAVMREEGAGLYLHEGPRENFLRKWADAILAAGFRRQGPITDAQVEAAAKSLIWADWDEPWPAEEKWSGVVGYGASTDRDDLLRFARAALEAARDAS